MPIVDPDPIAPRPHPEDTPPMKETVRPGDSDALTRRKAEPGCRLEGEFAPDHPPAVREPGVLPSDTPGAEFPIAGMFGLLTRATHSPRIGRNGKPQLNRRTGGVKAKRSKTGDQVGRVLT